MLRIKREILSIIIIIAAYVQLNSVVKVR